MDNDLDRTRFDRRELLRARHSLWFREKVRSHIEPMNPAKHLKIFVDPRAPVFSGVTGMNQERLAYFRKELWTWQGQIQRALKNSLHSRLESQDPEPDVADRVVRSYEKELAFLTSIQHEDRLRKVQQALRRVSAGEYGRCAGCHDEIKPKRLEAMPWAQYCIECQQNLERGAA